MSKIISNRALGTPASGIRKIFNKVAGMRDIVHLEIGEPDFDTPQPIKDAANRALIDGYTHYTHNAGLIELRATIADYYRDFWGIDIEAENTIVTTGGTGGLFLALLTTVDVNDEVLIPNPGYPPYTSMVKMIGARPSYYILKEENGFMPDLDEINEKIMDKTKAIIVNTPNNPSGAVYPKEVLKGIVEIAEDNNLVVISDEVYERITYDGVRHYSMLNFDEISDRVIVVNSFSKTFAMTGWRVGFAISRNTDIIRNMTKLQESVAACAPAMAQKAAIVALKECQEHVNSMVNAFERRRDLLVRLLRDINDVSFVVPKGTFYLMLNISRYIRDSYEFAEKFLSEKKVAVAPGKAFGDNAEGYIRISFANSEENIKTGIERLKEFLESLE